MNPLPPPCPRSLRWGAELQFLVDCRVGLSGQALNIASAQYLKYTCPKANPERILPDDLLLDLDEPHGREAIYTN